KSRAGKNTGSPSCRSGSPLGAAIITVLDPPAGEAARSTRTAAEGATPVIAQAHVPPAGTTLERPVKPGAEGAWGRVRAPPPNSQAKGQRGAPRACTRPLRARQSPQAMSKQPASLRSLEHHDAFVERHIGPNADEVAQMLRVVGHESLDAM